MTIDSTNEFLIPTNKPVHVRFSVLILWITWAISLIMLIYDWAFAHTFEINMPTLGSIAGLVVQATIIYFIARGSNVARMIFTAIFLIAITGIIFASSQHFLPAVSLLTTFSFVLKVIAVALLFTSSSRPWFKKRYKNDF